MEKNQVTIYNDNDLRMSYMTAAVSFLTAYSSFIDSKDKSPAKQLPMFLIAAMSGYMAYSQFQKAKTVLNIVDERKKLGNVGTNQIIA
jgi:hypothetical protein